MPRFTSSSQITPTNWLGLAWVYSAVLWMAPIWIGWSGGNGELAVLAVLRMLATVALGVGICGNERWGWAAALALAGAYVVLSASLLAVIGAALASRPEGALSWQPVLWGLTAGHSGQLAGMAGLVTAISGVAAALLWRARSGFDVPPRQFYGAIVRFGLGPALCILALDGGMLLTWR
ncbi:MAG: hypothetical protein ACO1SX_15655 [Actinomycetota bacterium]